ncbi:hypothetical protein SNE40_011681 [Patella caerulea]|uniref:Uncharacterized protein n=1 Tax=Patella caerulea TaxID=87958 RepID=A0AAN8JN84_PATCE
MKNLLPNYIVTTFLHNGKRYTQRRIILASVLLLFSGLVYLIYHVTFNIGIWYGNPYVGTWCRYEKVPKFAVKHEPDEITVVTSLFDLGLVKKGNGLLDYHSPFKYKQWVRPFSKLTNPVVVFVEDDETAQYVKKVRSCIPTTHTKIIKVKRKDLWAFSLFRQIKDIYSQSVYPKHYPYTTSAEFSCLTHAKYEFLLNVTQENYFKTPYFAWVDVTAFRKLDESGTGIFKLIPPSKFDREKVGFTQVGPHDPHLDLDFVMMYRAVWVSGSMVLGTNSTIKRFVQVYKKSVESLLDKGLANTDEHIIYAMYTQKMKQPDRVKIHAYRCHQGQLGLMGKDAYYYCLLYLCKYTWENIHGGVASKIGL